MWGCLAIAWVAAGMPSRFQDKDCNLNTRLVRSWQFSDVSGLPTLSADGRKLAVPKRKRLEFWDTISQLQLEDLNLQYVELFSPSLNYTILGSDLFNFQTKAWVHLTPPLSTDSSGKIAWSWDEKLIVVGNNTGIAIYDVASGEIIRYWTLPSGLGPKRGGVCWSPTLIAISTWRSSDPKGPLLRYHSNGTLASERSLPFPVEDGPVQDTLMRINSESTVAFADWYSLHLVDLPGNIFATDQQNPSSSMILGRNVLAVCGPANSAQTCKLYDMRASLLLEISETFRHVLLGLSLDDKTMITYFQGGVYWWNVHTPQVRTLKISSIKPHVRWIDRDRVLISERDQMELNIRTGQFGEFGGGAFPYRMHCAMDGEFYTILGGKTIVVVAAGKEIRRWSLEGQMQSVWDLQCSRGVVGTVATSDKAFYWLGWSASGVLADHISLGSQSPDSVALYNSSSLALGFFYPLSVSFWNPQTSLLEPTGLHAGHTMQWSPDGSWLAIPPAFIGGEEATLILNHARVIVMKVNAGSPLSLSWSPDSNWLILPGSPSYLVSPTLNVTYFLEGKSTSSVTWNPEVMEIMSMFESNLGSTLRFWIPTPSSVQLLAENQAGTQSTAKIALVGAASLPSAVKTMIHWVDSSTGVAQCFFYNATVIDAFTLSLGNITLPDPAIYSVHVQYPTTHSDSPWLSSATQFAVNCPKSTLPALNLTGVTSCVCPDDHYRVPTPNGTVKCQGCPLHTHCNGSDVVLSDEGYWPTTENPYRFLPCAAGACKPDNRCSTCHEGPLCGLCQAGCGQHGFGRCQACKSLGMNALLIALGLLCWVGLCSIQSLFALGWRNSKSRSNNSAQLVAIIVSTAQMHALLLNVNVKMESFSLPGFTEEQTQGAGIQSAVISCALIHYRLSPSHVHFVKQAMMLILPLLGWILLLILRVCLRCRGIVTSTAVVKVPLIVIWSSLQTPITKTCSPLSTYGGIKCWHNVD